MTEQYMLYKSHGICVQCGQRDARRGRVLCADCADRQNAMSLKWFEVHREELLPKMRKANHERYARLKADGICVTCGKRLAVEGRVRCSFCAAKTARYKTEKYREQFDALPRFLFGDGDHCGHCGKAVEHGTKLCPKCYEKACENIAKAQEANPKTGGFYKPFYFGKKDR